MFRKLFLDMVANAARKIAEIAEEAADKSAEKPAPKKEHRKQAEQPVADTEPRVGAFNPPLEHPQLVLKREKVLHMNEMYTVVAGFDHNADMRNVVIPDGVVGLERDCFRKCTALEEVYIPDSVNFMDGDVFEGCTSLRKARLSPALTEIPFWGFRDCTSLKEIEIPRKVHRIGFCAFWNSGLESVTLPEGVETIQLSAFSLCYHLASIGLPASLKEIEDSAFESTKELTSVTLPKGLRSLGERTFWHSGIASIDIPPKLTELRNRTFRDCVNLRSIFIPDNIKTIGNEVFMGCTSLETVRIPVWTFIDETVFEDCAALKEFTAGKITVDIAPESPNAQVGKLIAFIARCVRIGRFEPAVVAAPEMNDTYLTDIAFQLGEQGMRGAWEFVGADMNKALSCMASLGRPAAFDALVRRGARITPEETDGYIRRAIEEERREMYIALLRYKRDILGYDTDEEDAVSGRFRL